MSRHLGGTFTVFSREGTLLHDAEKRCQAAPQHRAGPRITERLPPNSMAGPSDSTHEGAGPGLPRYFLCSRSVSMLGGGSLPGSA